LATIIDEDSGDSPSINVDGDDHGVGMFGTMGTTSLGLDRKEQGDLPRVDLLGLRRWARRPITEVV
jgi:hypothetical protein